MRDKNCQDIYFPSALLSAYNLVVFYKKGCTIKDASKNSNGNLFATSNNTENQKR
jgi:hypothetical protein